MLATTASASATSATTFVRVAHRPEQQERARDDRGTRKEPVADKPNQPKAAEHVDSVMGPAEIAEINEPQDVCQQERDRKHAQQDRERHVGDAAMAVAHGLDLLADRITGRG